LFFNDAEASSESLHGSGATAIKVDTTQRILIKYDKVIT